MKSLKKKKRGPDLSFYIVYHVPRPKNLQFGNFSRSSVTWLMFPPTAAIVWITIAWYTEQVAITSPSVTTLSTAPIFYNEGGVLRDHIFHCLRDFSFCQGGPKRERVVSQHHWMPLSSIVPEKLSLNGKVQLKWHITYSNVTMVHCVSPISHTCTLSSVLHNAAVDWWGVKIWIWRSGFKHSLLTHNLKQQFVKSTPPSHPHEQVYQKNKDEENKRNDPASHLIRSEPLGEMVTLGIHSQVGRGLEPPAGPAPRSKIHN